MAKRKEKQQAISLRKAGNSYSQIKQILKVSKSTLSCWLQGYPLPPERIRALRDWNQVRIEHYRETRRKKREAMLREIYISERKKILPISEREAFIGGLFLYLGEGGKTKPFELSLSNTDPAIIKFFIYWLTEILNVPRTKLKIKMHFYKDMNIKREKKFWSKELNIPLSQFQKPYIKETFYHAITYKRGFGHGTCNVIIADGILAKKILTGLQVVRDYFHTRL